MKHKHIFKTILLALLLLTAVAGGNGAWAQSHPNIGSISYNSTLGAYAITNVNNLKDLSVYVNGEGTYSTGGTETTPHNCSGLTFKQTSNIDCRYINDTIRAIGSYGNSQGVSSRDLTDTWRPFNGTYDGQGHVIDALKVKGDSYFRTHSQAFFCAGFFGVVDEGTVLRNIRLVNPSVCNAISLEAVMSGSAKSGRVPVDKWYSNLVFVRYDMAGIVGVTEGGSIENCYVFNPQFRFTHADSLEFLELSTYKERALGIDMSAICTENNSSTITGCSEVYIVREGPDVSFADNSVPSNVGFTYSGSRFYKPGSAIAIQCNQIRTGCNLGFTDGEGHNLNFSGSIPNYTITSRGNNSVITWTFTPIAYQLSYDNIDDATFVTPNPSTYTIETETFTLSRPSREGYTFLGWVGTDQPRVTKEVTIPRGSMGDRHYTAQWVEGVEPIFEVRNQNNTFIIKRDVTTTEQTVYYRTVALTAIAGQHFTQTSGTVTFAVGDSAKVINVTERTPNADAYKYQTGTSRTYRFEVLDDGGFELAHKDRSITNGLTQFSATKVSKTVTNLVTMNNGSISSGMSSSKYLDVSYTPPSSQVETSGTLSGYVLIDDSYDYAQKPATVSTSTLINSTGATASYLNTLGYKIYATVYFTEKERDDGYQYIQIIAGNSTHSYDTGYDPEGSVNDPANSVYKVCFELSDGSNAEGKAYFPHRSTGTDEFSLSTGKLWQQKFKSGYSASGSVLLSPTVDSITTRFDAGGNNDDTWGYKDFKVRMALCDAVAPTRPDNPIVNPGLHAKGNIAYISVPFNEIVTVTGTPILNTSWGTLKYYAGSGTNVLTFADTITATEGTRLQITSCTNYSNIKDLAGNPLNGNISYYGFAYGDTVTASHDYNITYTLNGGTATPANPATYNYSTPTFTLTNPARAGYTFNGWTGSDLTEASMNVTVATHSHGDKRFIANWSSPIIYSIDYDLADGSLETPNQESYTVESDDIIIVNPTRDNYIFIGWTGTDLASPTRSVTIAQGSTGDRSYTANWHPLWGIALGADGSVEHPYQIAATLDLDSLAARVNRGTDYSGIYFLQTADITYDGTTNNYTPVGRLEANTFGGSYDGGGYTISGININANASSDNNFGLFGRIAATATVQRITLASTTITARSNVGGIVGVNGGGAVQDCRVESTVTINAGTANYAYNHGGVVGSNLYGGTIRGCLSAATVSRQKNSDNARYGGIVGNNENTNPIVANCLFIGPTPTSTGSVGSIAGFNYTTTILINNYYTESTIGGVNGNDISGARKAHTVTLGTDISLVGDETVYSNSGLTAIGATALRLSDGTIYSGATQTLTLSYNGDIPTGYHVVFSYNDGSDHTLASNSLTMPDADITVSSSIEATTYTISYDLAGGIVATPNPTSYTVESNITLVNPTREGYDFTGWTGTGLAEPTMSVTIADSIGNRSYTATWTPHIYAINYNLNGGSVSTPNPSTYIIESTDITLANPTRDGYTFAGWTGTGLDAATMTVTIEQGSTGDRSYTATWTPIDYTISYDLAGGSVVTPNPTSYTIESSDITLANPTRTGYTFAGWTGTDLDSATLSVTIEHGSTGGRSYTATWTINVYTISYDLADGSVATPNPTSYTVESADITLTNPTRDGYTFAGWTGTDLDAATMSVTIEHGSTGNRTYAATWVINFSITYDLAGGSVATPNPVYYTVLSDDITLVNPTRDHYDFAGWIGTDLDAATLSVTIAHGSTGDRTYTATWTPISYTISYDLAGGSASNPTHYSIESDDITLVNPTRNHYNFAGWTGTGLAEPTMSVTIEHGSTGARSYTATWTPVVYTITYNLNGGSATNPTSYTIESDDITLVNPTRTGYTFLGWLGTGLTKFTMSVTIPHGSTGDRTYTADWPLDAPYSYDFEDGDGWFYWQSLSGDNARVRGGASYSGLGFLRFKGSTSNIVALPIFNTASSSLRLSFWTRPETSYNNYSGTFSVGYLTDPADTATFVALRTYNSTDWTPIGYRHKVVNFEGAPDGVRLAFRHNPTNSNNDWFVDDVEVTAPDCFPLEDLAVSNIGVGAATFNWLAATGTRWEYALVANAAADYTPTDGDFTGTYTASQSGTQSITFSTLDEYTPYAFFLRRVCSEQSKSAADSVRFRTRMTPTALPYTDDFESSNGWVLENGTLANQWVWGTAAHYDGTKSLYISNDGGATNAYSGDNTTAVYAWKTFSFDDGKYEFSYDWRAEGEQYSDYLRVALAPDGTEFTADADVPNGFEFFSLPSGWIALDGRKQLYGNGEWSHFVTDLITLAAGTYRMVFVWRNEGSYEKNPPAAIDNVRIVKQKCFVTAGSWDNAANWEPAGVPGADENVYIEAAAVIPAGCVAVCDHASINGGSVTVADGGQLVCNSDFPVTVQKNVTAGRWNGISGLYNVWNLSPLTSDVAYDLFRYDEEHAQWLNQKAGDAAAGFNNLRYFTGYIYRRAASATINLATHNYDGNWSFNYFASCSDDALRGFNLAGNPCTHDIYFGTGIRVRNGSIAPGFYTLNADGTWRAHTTADPIHVAEAFLIQVTTDNAVLYFENTNAAPAQSKAAPAATLAFAVKGGGHEDVAYAMMGDMGLMGSMGLRKMPHLNAEAHSLSIDGYAIASLSDSTQAFPLTLQAQPGEYSIGLMGLMGDMGTVDYCHLVDKVAGRDIDLLRDSTYTFTQSRNQAITDRFLVKLSPNGGVESGTWRVENFARWDGDKLIVTGEGTLQVFDMMGRQLFTREANSSLIIHHSSFPSTGVYMLRLGGQSQKIVIR